VILLQWLPELEELRVQLEGHTGHRFNSVLCNQYRDCKDHVAWHSDDEKLFGVNPTIATISLGDVRNFELRKKVGPVSGLIIFFTVVRCRTVCESTNEFDKDR